MNGVHATIKHLFVTMPNFDKLKKNSPANRMIKFEIKSLLSKPLYLKCAALLPVDCH